MVVDAICDWFDEDGISFSEEVAARERDLVMYGDLLNILPCEFDMRLFHLSSFCAKELEEFTLTLLIVTLSFCESFVSLLLMLPFGFPFKIGKLRCDIVEAWVIVFCTEREGVPANAFTRSSKESFLSEVVTSDRAGMSKTVGVSYEILCFYERVSVQDIEIY